MQQTANYNLNLPEGTDVVNPLVDYNPNFSTIDSAMKANADRTVGRATCIKSGTTHVVTRSNTGSNIINFTATGDWNTGDTMTIDSTIVSVFLPDGSAALDGAYLINSEVFGILNGTRFTLYSNITERTAAATSYDNTNSGLSANNVQDAIDELDGDVDDIRKNNAGTRVDISSYNTLNPYTAPSDGYLELNTSNGASESGNVRILGANDVIACYASASFPNVSTTYIKKGMKLAVQSASTNMIIVFVPLQ